LAKVAKGDKRNRPCVSPTVKGMAKKGSQAKYFVTKKGRRNQLCRGHRFVQIMTATRKIQVILAEEAGKTGRLEKMKTVKLGNRRWRLGEPTPMRKGTSSGNGRVNRDLTGVASPKGHGMHNRARTKAKGEKSRKNTRAAATQIKKMVRK